MIINFKIFEQVDLDKNQEIIATNHSYYSWEYDSYTVDAYLILDRNDDSLYLKINKTHVKSGLGAGKFKTELFNGKVGTVNNAKLGLIRTLLKKFGMNQIKFSKHWEDEEGNKMSLTDLISEYKSEKKLKNIEPIKTYAPKRTTKKELDLVKYSDRSYALFGEGTIKIKDKLSKIGGKYNPYLKDPRTGKKRPGWIFSINKLDKLKEII